MLSLILTASIGATSFHHPLSLEELSARAEKVVVGEVLSLIHI